MTTSSQLRLWIIALSHVVSRLERVHSALVEAVLSMSWTTMDSNFVKSYTSFVGMLVSAKPEYLTLVLGKIANGFTYRACRIPASSHRHLPCVQSRVFRLWMHPFPRHLRNR